MRTAVLAGLVTCLIIIASPARADYMDVYAGNHTLLANTAGQVIHILVQGDGNVEGVLLQMQIGSGKNGEVPLIEDVDLTKPGFLFGDNNTGNRGEGSGVLVGYGGYWEAETSTDPGTTVTPNGQKIVLAEVTIDTTGFGAGNSFDFTLNGNVEGTDIVTNFAGWEDMAGHTLNVYNGTIDIVPEPASLALLCSGFVGLGLATFVRRRRRVAQ